jgi:hypothetical protein
VRRTRTSSQRRLRILVAMRINLEQTPAPTRNARVASATRAYARWSSKASATTAQHVRSLRHECSRRLPGARWCRRIGDCVCDPDKTTSAPLSEFRGRKRDRARGHVRGSPGHGSPSSPLALS